MFRNKFTIDGGLIMGLLNPISAAVKLVNAVEKVGKTLISTTLDVAEMAVEVGNKMPFGSFDFEASMTRLALEKALDIADSAAPQN